MATIYVRSTDGNNSDNGSTWALAKLDLAGAAAIDAAGDVIYVSDNHAESTGASVTLAFAGTAASPVQIVCVDDSAEPPTAVSTAGTATVSGTTLSFVIQGNLYCYGLRFNAGNAITLGTANNSQTYENCKFTLTNTGTSGIFTWGNHTNGPGTLRLKNCDISFANAAHYINLGGLFFEWEGGSVLSGSSTPTGGMFRNTERVGRGAIVSGVNFSNCSSSLILSTATLPGKFVFRNCRMPSGWSTGNLWTGTKVAGFRAELYNCDSGDTNYVLQIEDFCGTILHEPTIVRTGGASDGTTTLSWKMVSNATAEYPHQALNSPEIVRWNETTGSSITVTVETITDNVTLTDGECWLEVQYLGTSGVPLSSFIEDAKADVLATAANQTTSSETWTTTGLTTPVKQKLSVTFTPQEKGFIHAVVKLAKASTTVYVDPELTVT